MKIANRIEETLLLFKSTKLLVLMFGMSLVYGWMTTIALIFLFPLKEIRPYFLQVSNKSEQVVRVEPMQKEGDGLELYKESIVRQYVEDREKIDLHSDGERWLRLAFIHNEEIEIDFSDLMRQDNRDSPLHEFREQNMIRKVTILSSNCLAPVAPNVYQIEWLAEDCSTLAKDNYKILNRQVFISIITTELQDKIVDVENRLINPFGVTVVSYTVTRKTDVRR